MPKIEFNNAVINARNKADVKRYTAIGGKLVEPKTWVHISKPVEIEIEESKIDYYLSIGFEPGRLPQPDDKKAKKEKE